MIFEIAGPLPMRGESKVSENPKSSDFVYLAVIQIYCPSMAKTTNMYDDLTHSGLDSVTVSQSMNSETSWFV